MKNKVLVLALLLSFPFLLTACTLQDLPVIGKFFTQKSGPVTLTLWGMWESPDVIQTAIKKYQELHPNVTINYDDRSILKPVDYKERVFTQATQPLGADIIMVHNSWVPKLKSALSSMPTSLMDVQKYSSTFYPVATDSAVSDGKIYAIPMYYDGLVLVYNKKHLADIGQTTPPTAWEEFRRIAILLTVRSGERGEVLVRAGAAIGTANNIDHFSDILGLMWSQAGVTVPNDVDSRAAQDALTFYTNFVKEDGVWSGNFPEATAAFSQEKVSMIFVPSWQILDIIAARPDLDFGVAPVPQAIPQNPATWGSFWMSVVPTTSKNQTVAWDFLNFLAQDEQQLAMFNEASRIRPFGAPYAAVSLASQLQTNPYLKAVLDTAPYAKSAEIAGRSGNRRQVDALAEAIDAVLSNTSNSSDALKKVKESLAK